MLGKVPSQTTSAWERTFVPDPARWGRIMFRLQVIVVGPPPPPPPPPPPGSQVSPHWSLGPMPPAAGAAGATVKPNVWLTAAGVGVVAAWAGAATAMAAPASALLKRGINAPSSR